jgi:hypothetical protein
VRISLDAASIAIRVEEKHEEIADCGLGDLMHLPIKAYSRDVYSRLGVARANSSNVAEQTGLWTQTRRSSS